MQAQPFSRFVLQTVGGARYVVDHPEAAWLTRGGRTVYINLPGGDGERVHAVDTAVIERIEPDQAPLP